MNYKQLIKNIFLKENNENTYETFEFISAKEILNKKSKNNFLNSKNSWIDMSNKFSSKRKRYHRILTPNKKLLNSKDLASIVLNLMEPHWRHANGSIININDGVYS